MSREAKKTTEGLTLKAYRGDGAALLAFDVDERIRGDLAGFAVSCEPPKGKAYPLLNRLSLERAIVSETTPSQRKWTPTDEAPLQKFHWTHYPKEVTEGTFTYRATAMLFKKDSETELEPGPSSEVSLELWEEGFGNFELGFTRGYLSSQAYAERFHNAPIAPSPQTVEYDTAPFAERYSWLGAHAGKLIFNFLEQALSDGDVSLDVFAYDLDEPDLIRRLADFGPRLRLFLDDSERHKASTSRESAALKVLRDTAGAENVKVAHFGRFAHDKVLIQRRGEAAQRVLSGSANFSVRGLYAQSNNVFVFDDPDTAGLYERAFEQAFTDPRGFRQSEIASGWSGSSGEDLPGFEASFAPHSDAEVSLGPVANAINGAKSSVLFSIMELGGGGPVLEAVNELGSRDDIYAFGTTQDSSGGLQVTSPATPDSIFVPFAYLHSKVPEPFREEFSGGPGQVIHHKFVVCDFNGERPAVFAGSSNLAKGGEEENGDNLVAFRDPAIASTYAVEAIRLIDHYRFRAAMKDATEAAPLRLRTRSDEWARDYFETGSPRYRERELFVH